MTLTRKQSKTWVCVKCGHRNEWRGTSRKCQGCLSPVGRRKKRVPLHARTLRDDSPEFYAELSQKIHGGDLGACGCCRRPKPESGNHDREHDHANGNPRGLGCFRCNHVLLRNHTLESLRMCVAYLERVEAFYQARENEE